MSIHLRWGIRALAVGAGAGLATLIASACSSDRPEFTGPPGKLVEDASSPDGGECGFRCSRDLKSVLNGCSGGEEKEVEKCGPDQGCGVDTCVDACTAAELSKGSVGCSFWTLPPDDGVKGPGACFVAMIANTWDRAVNLSAELGDAPLDISQSIYTATLNGKTPVYTKVTGPVPPGEVALVFLSQAESPRDPDASRCPKEVVPALKADPIRHNTAKTQAFHIKSDAPVAAYSIFPYGGAESFYPTATLLLPVTSWDRSYIAVTTGWFGPIGRSDVDKRTLQIVADQDGTEISMRPREVLIQGDGVEGAAAGTTKSWTLSRGQVLQITQLPELAGSPISSNKPVGLFGGSPCTYLPNNFEYCDLTQQQIAPFSQWGTEYALVPYKPRVHSLSSTSSRENVYWNMVGAVDGTVLSYDPERPPGAPETLSAGQVVPFLTDARVTVKSQDSKHPFYVGVHMTGSMFGGGVPGGAVTRGDPDFVTIVPTDQFLDRYVFFTDYTFPDTHIAVVRRKTANGFRPVTLSCAGELTGFVPLGERGEYEYTFVDLTKDFAPEKFDKGECGYGRHEAESDGPFSITVWGLGRDASYGYAGGMGSRPVNDAPPPIIR